MFSKKDSVEYRQLVEGVHLQTVAHGEKTLMGKFKLAKGAEIPPHAHPHEQTGMMISGKLRFKIGDDVRVAETGDSWCIPGNVAHSVVALEDSLVVEVFSPVREDYLV